MDDTLRDEINKYPTLQRELCDIFVGKKIGTGSARHVYECAIDSDCVIKIEQHAGSFQNVMEWETWNTVKETKNAKWFAPCMYISPNGLILIQKKAEKTHKGQFPKKIPTFFTDRKYDNFGMIGKQFVCIDYGTLYMPAISKSLISKKLSAAHFWNEII